MFKFLADIKELKRDVKEIFDEFNNDYAFTGFFSRRRTLSKKVAKKAAKKTAKRA